MRKKVDERIRTLIDNGVKTRRRSLFVIIGDKSRDQIVNLHYMLTKAVVKAKPSVLWCYKDKLELSSHKKKRANEVKKLMRSGLLDPEKVDPFSLFLETASITYCLYKDSDRVLGNTFGMCILQDFEELTPNLLARTIETVEGGGIILLLLRSINSLTTLCTMVKDVHKRYRIESHSEAAGRFNERLILSIASCKACVVMDDELNILPISSHITSITPIPVDKDAEGLSEAQRDLKNLKDELRDDFPVGPLIKKCCTFDQGKAVLTLLDAILDKTLRNTVALLAARGRGKSAALGLAVAGAVAAGYSNIVVTAPSPDNLKTLFDFVHKGFDSLEYKEHIDYEIVKSSNPDLKKATVGINIYKQHRRQTIEYMQPHEHEKLSRVDLLVIDEAAAIPLPFVKSLLGPYLVFMSSTVNGYEGTGRSLSLKLLQQLTEQSQLSKIFDSPVSGRILKKIELNESIRYASGDPIESWLNGLLCLDVVNYIPKISRLPSPDECDLFYVNRDTLFSYHKDSELFLQRMMALFVASDYKNSPNDLQLMSDAPAHHLFVLLGPVDESKNCLPDILCVIQVCLEGEISKSSAQKSLKEGRSPHGDQIPWTYYQQFQDTNFLSLSGARIVRIATHPSAIRLGYGSAAPDKVKTLYYEGQLSSASESDDELSVQAPIVRGAEKASLLEEESIKPRANLPALLVHLGERRAEKLHYIGVSFGLTLELLNFWKRHKFAPFYIDQIPNAVTGENTCMVLKPLRNDDIEIDHFGPNDQEFKRDFSRLLGSGFSSMEYKLAMSVLEPEYKFEEPGSTSDGISDSILHEYINNKDIERLQAYTDNPADYKTIRGIVQVLAHLYFQKRIPVGLTAAQTSILLCIGLQNRDMSYIQGQMKLEKNQIMSAFEKMMKKLYRYVYDIASKQIESTLPPKKEIQLKPHRISLEEDLEDAAKEVKRDMKAKTERMLDPELLKEYAIDGDFESTLQNVGGKIPSSGLISVKSSKTKSEKSKASSSSKSEKKRGKDDRGSKSKKKRKS